MNLLFVYIYIMSDPFANLQQFVDTMAPGTPITWSIVANSKLCTLYGITAKENMAFLTKIKTNGNIELYEFIKNQKNSDPNYGAFELALATSNPNNTKFSGAQAQAQAQVPNAQVPNAQVLSVQTQVPVVQVSSVQVPSGQEISDEPQPEQPALLEETTLESINVTEKIKDAPTNCFISISVVDYIIKNGKPPTTFAPLYYAGTINTNVATITLPNAITQYSNISSAKFKMGYANFTGTVFPKLTSTIEKTPNIIILQNLEYRFKILLFNCCQNIVDAAIKLQGDGQMYYNMLDTFMQYKIDKCANIIHDQFIASNFFRESKTYGSNPQLLDLARTISYVDDLYKTYLYCYDYLYNKSEDDIFTPMIPITSSSSLATVSCFGKNMVPIGVTINMNQPNISTPGNMSEIQKIAIAIYPVQNIVSVILQLNILCMVKCNKQMNVSNIFNCVKTLSQADPRIITYSAKQVIEKQLNVQIKTSGILDYTGILCPTRISGKFIKNILFTLSASECGGIEFMTGITNGNFDKKYDKIYAINKVNNDRTGFHKTNNILIDPTAIKKCVQSMKVGIKQENVGSIKEYIDFGRTRYTAKGGQFAISKSTTTPAAAAPINKPTTQLPPQKYLEAFGKQINEENIKKVEKIISEMPGELSTSANDYIRSKINADKTIKKAQ